MRRKTEEREEARKIRRSGESIKAIARKVGVSVSSVSKWVRDIELTDEQRAILESNRCLGWRSEEAIGKRLQGYREQREKWQEEGADMYDREGKEFAAVCALYWGEGSKGKSKVCLDNTDEGMMTLFVSFLRKYFQVRDDELRVSVNCYLDNGLTLEQIQGYWLDAFGLPEGCLRKATVKSKYYRGKSSAKHPYGVCRVYVCRTDIVQKIFGAIAQMAGTNGERWLG